jgi:two-component system cell cycle sensor histidine kinase/response regulator CckA
MPSLMTTTLGDLVPSKEPRMNRREPTAAEAMAENQALGRELEATRAHVRQLEEQLRDAQRFETLGRLASAVAHDFSNVLAVIVGYTDLMLRRMDPTEPMRGSVESIRKATAWGQRLTEQVVASGRGQTAQATGPLDVNAVTATLTRTLQPLLGERIEVVTRLDPALGAVNVGASQFEQVLMNLLVNARDAMEGGGRVTIETANVDLEQGPSRPRRPGVMVRVSDTGAGMDAATLSRVFEPYFTTKAPGKGTGLGLSTVFGIVTQHGGHVEVTSEVGEGASFTLYLPRVPAPAEDPTDAPPAVLVLEDESGVRELIVEILELHDFPVLQARDLDEAARMASRHAGPIALVVADLMAPGVRADRLFERLGATRPGIKILYISGDLEDVTEEARHRRHLIHKPFTVDGLVRKVREVLDSP